VVPELPEIAGFRARCPPRLRQRLIEVKRLGTLPPLADLEAAEQLLHLVLGEAREREVDVGRRLEVGEQPGEEGVVPGPRELVQGEPEEPGLLDRDVEPGHGHRRQPEAAGRDEALVPADHGAILSSGQHRLREAELAQAPFECVELVLADPAGVRRVGPEALDRDLFDGEGGECGRCRHRGRTSVVGWKRDDLGMDEKAARPAGTPTMRFRQTV